MSTPIIDKLEKAIRAAPPGGITLEYLLSLMGQCSLGILLLVIAIAALLPLPATGIPLGAMLMLVGLQMLLGNQKPWLPQKIAQRRVPPEPLLKILKQLKPFFSAIHPYVHRRLPGVVRTKGERVAGLMVMLLAFFVMVPLPFTNMLPTLSIMVLALAFIQQDGLLALAAHLLGLLSVRLMLYLYGGVFAAAYQAWIGW